MNDTFCVRRRERPRDARAEREGIRELHRSILQGLVERCAVEPLHREVLASVTRRPVRDVLDDSGITQPIEQRRLALETRIRVHALDDLQSDLRACFAIVRFVDGRHAASSGDASDLESARDDGPLHDRHQHILDACTCG